MDPIPDVAHAYSMLSQEENQQKFAHISTVVPDNLAMNVRVNRQVHRNLLKSL